MSKRSSIDPLRKQNDTRRGPIRPSALKLTPGRQTRRDVGIHWAPQLTETQNVPINGYPENQGDSTDASQVSTATMGLPRRQPNEYDVSSIRRSATSYDRHTVSTPWIDCSRRSSSTVQPLNLCTEALLVLLLDLLKRGLTRFACGIKSWRQRRRGKDFPLCGERFLCPTGPSVSEKLRRTRNDNMEKNLSNGCWPNKNIKSSPTAGSRLTPASLLERLQGSPLQPDFPRCDGVIPSHVLHRGGLHLIGAFSSHRTTPFSFHRDEEGTSIPLDIIEDLYGSTLSRADEEASTSNRGHRSRDAYPFGSLRPPLPMLDWSGALDNDDDVGAGVAVKGLMRLERTAMPKPSPRSTVAGGLGASGVMPSRGSRVEVNTPRSNHCSGKSGFFELGGYPPYLLADTKPPHLSNESNESQRRYYLYTPTVMTMDDNHILLIRVVRPSSPRMLPRLVFSVVTMTNTVDQDVAQEIFNWVSFKLPVQLTRSAGLWPLNLSDSQSRNFQWRHGLTLKLRFTHPLRINVYNDQPSYRSTIESCASSDHEHPFSDTRMTTSSLNNGATTPPPTVLLASVEFSGLGLDVGYTMIPMISAHSRNPEARHQRNISHRQLLSVLVLSEKVSTCSLKLMIPHFSLNLHKNDKTLEILAFTGLILALSGREVKKSTPMIDPSGSINWELTSENSRRLQDCPCSPGQFGTRNNENMTQNRTTGRLPVSASASQVRPACQISPLQVKQLLSMLCLEQKKTTKMGSLISPPRLNDSFLSGYNSASVKSSTLDTIPNSSPQLANLGSFIDQWLIDEACVEFKDRHHHGNDQSTDVFKNNEDVAVVTGSRPSVVEVKLDLAALVPWSVEFFQHLLSLQDQYNAILTPLESERSTTQFIRSPFFRDLPGPSVPAIMITGPIRLPICTIGLDLRSRKALVSSRGPNLLKAANVALTIQLIHEVLASIHSMRGSHVRLQSRINRNNSRPDADERDSRLNYRWLLSGPSDHTTSNSQNGFRYQTINTRDSLHPELPTNNERIGSHNKDGNIMWPLAYRRCARPQSALWLATGERRASLEALIKRQRKYISIIQKIQNTKRDNQLVLGKVLEVHDASIVVPGITVHHSSGTGLPIAQSSEALVTVLIGKSSYYETILWQVLTSLSALGRPSQLLRRFTTNLDEAEGPSDSRSQDDGRQAISSLQPCLPRLHSGMIRSLWESLTATVSLWANVAFAVVDIARTKEAEGKQDDRQTSV